MRLSGAIALTLLLAGGCRSDGVRSGALEHAVANSDERPVPQTLTPEAIDRALASGDGVSVTYRDFAAPVGDSYVVGIAPDGAVSGEVPRDRSATRTDPLRVAGTLSRGQREAVLAAVRTAPFAAYRADPVENAVMDGRTVYLLVAAGPAAFEAHSQWKDFRRCGLATLCDTLRRVLLEMPPADAP